MRARIQALMVRLADGDRTAIEPAFAELWPVVQRFCARALQGEGDAEDAAQQAIVRAFEQAASFDAQRDATAWVLTIAAFECRTIRRRRERRREGGLDAAHRLPSKDAGPEELAARRNLVAALRDAIAELSPEDEETILAAMDLGGARAGVAPATFRKRLQRALERLRFVWRTKHGTE